MKRLTFAIVIFLAFALGGVTTLMGLPRPNRVPASAPAPTSTFAPVPPASSDESAEPLDRRLEQMLDIYR